jgi:type 1 glutamine amidotransferase
LSVRRLHLVSGGRYHDFDLARRRILEVMAADERIRATCASDFSDVGSRLADRVGLVLYTCDTRPSAAEAQALDAWVRGGGRLFALHATNALLRFTDGPAIVTSGVHIPGKVYSTSEQDAPEYMQLLGSAFLSHLAQQDMTVRVADPADPLVAGLPDFTIFDEPYVMRLLDPQARVLLTSRYSGPAPGYVLDHFEPEDRPQLYVKPHGAGGVLYLTLGHCCGKYDLQPMMDEAPVVDAPWRHPQFLEIVRRGIAWCADG